MSGAGKSLAADILEDMDYYCVDNMPVALLPRFAELCLATRGRYERVALVTDVRERESISGLIEALDRLWEQGLEYRILYVEADMPTIVRRYKSSRRPHPMLAGGSIEEAVRLEVAALAPLRERADYIINTTGLTTAMLQARIAALLPGGAGARRLAVTVTAFGYKYGIPIDADLVLDVRFLPNPYYIEELKDLSGLDQPVYDFVMQQPDTAEYMRLLTAFIDFQLPRFREEGKPALTVAVGCTGGRHRSISVARALTDHLLERGQNARLVCRDLARVNEQ